MLTQDEELWAKELPPGVEELLAEGKDPVADRSDRSRPSAGLKRDKTKVINYRVPHNAAVQIYDYKEKKARLGDIHTFIPCSLSLLAGAHIIN